MLIKPAFAADAACPSLSFSLSQLGLCTKRNRQAYLMGSIVCLAFLELLLLLLLLLPATLIVALDITEVVVVVVRHDLRPIVVLKTK